MIRDVITAKWIPWMYYGTGNGKTGRLRVRRVNGDHVELHMITIRLRVFMNAVMILRVQHSRIICWLFKNLASCSYSDLWPVQNHRNWESSPERTIMIFLVFYLPCYCNLYSTPPPPQISSTPSLSEYEQIHSQYSTKILSRVLVTIDGVWIGE
jgi:hypothetical protein